MNNLRPEMIFAKRFAEILESPGMYIGWANIFKLKAYMDGYVGARREDGFKNETDPYHGFQAWVQRRLEVRSTHDWANIISFAGTSEPTAFDLVAKLWNEYLDEFTASNENNSDEK